MNGTPPVSSDYGFFDGTSGSYLPNQSWFHECSEYTQHEVITKMLLCDVNVPISLIFKTEVMLHILRLSFWII